ncbi:hypothetical protein [Alkalimarinus sediminis]|uniref:Polysaccharide chain length determinant N-terminal domain-containing protein n=1 Tax=Alkalimarinus sediminis TaxID=1632866 RepID=A0A9E8HHG9_9ALTE|nr:hypothetical protein [Alkalimarinus sediminis]UZW73437.1 hypothetical protein NNL22_10280 [Alkalimarinus sediminis]
MNQYVSPDAIRPSEDEIDLADLVRTIWRQKGLVLGVVVITVFMVMSYHLAKATFKTPNKVDFAISLTFLDADENSYPNGSPFSPNDLVSPSVLQRVIDSVDKNLNLESLTASLTVEPSNSLLQASENKLAVMLADAKTPEGIREAAEVELENLRNQSRSYLTISLNIDKSGIPSDDAVYLIQKVVDSWAQMAIERGLIDASINRPLTTFVVADNANIIDSYDNAANYLDSLSRAVDQLSGLPGSKGLAVGGMSLNDLQREIRTLKNANIGPLREFAYSNSLVLASKDAAIQVRLYSRQRLLKLEHERLTKLIASYDASLSQLGQSNVSDLQGSPTLNGQDSSPQFDQSFLSALLKLGTELGSVDSRKDLFDRRINATEELLDLEKEMAILDGVVNETFSKLDPHAILDSSLKQITIDLNSLQKQMDSFVVSARELIMQNNSQLYIVDSAPQLRGTGVMIAQKLSLYLVLAALLGLMLGVVLALVRGSVKKTSNSELLSIESRR